MINTSKRLTVTQAIRLQKILAMGPQDIKPVDTELDQLGWTERYDDQPDSTDVVDGAERRLYGYNGGIEQHLLPADWLDRIVP